MSIWKGRAASELRESILDQSFRFCVRCPLLPGPKECLTDSPPISLQPDTIMVLTLNHDPTCNLKCPSCRSKPRILEPSGSAVHESLLTSGLLKHVKRLCASGDGDPVASPLIWHLLCHLPLGECDPELTINLQTNGLLLTREKWNELGDTREKITEISISIDAACEHTYGLNRGGDWFRLLENLEWMRSQKFKVQMNFVIQDNNFKEMADFVELANGYGANRIYFSTLNNWDTWSQAEYLMKAVHLPAHPQHREFLEMLDDPMLQVSDRITIIGMPNSKKFREET
jgi:MoaA/NifB/PqqE/SkfB family radical SAM enzyme